jgi:HPt (histidine-containing phosphotransfer) domain-containing protein
MKADVVKKGAAAARGGPAGVVDFERAIDDIGSPEDYAEICTTFLDELPRTLADIERARRSPPEATLRLLHEAATSAGIVGAYAVARDLRQLEVAARAGKVADPKPLLDSAARALSQVATCLRKRLPELTG